MLFELYAQSLDATALYSFYFTLLLSMSISAFWLINDTSFIDSSLVQVKFKPSASETAFKNKADLGTSFHLQILKMIKIKIDPGDEDSHFSPLVETR